MFISKLSIDGYRNCCEKSQISFNKGLNILVGENASGKSTIIDALRLILKDQEQSYITEDDFYKSFTQDVKNNNIRIDVTLENLNQEEKITFLSWCNANFDAELHLEVESNPSPRGYFKKSIWGGKSKASAFEEDTFDFINRNLLGGLYRENPVKSRNYEAVKSSKKWENVGNSYIIPALLLYRYSYI